MLNKNIFNISNINDVELQILNYVEFFEKVLINCIKYLCLPYFVYIAISSYVQ
jgi:hypothetical protein